MGLHKDKYKQQDFKKGRWAKGLHYRMTYLGNRSALHKDNQKTGLYYRKTDKTTDYKSVEGELSNKT